MQAPQDGSADTIVNLTLAPSYITYHAATVQHLMAFFHTQQVSLAFLHALLGHYIASRCMLPSLCPSTASSADDCMQ